MISRFASVIYFALIASTSPAHAATSAGRIEFQVLRNGSPFGRHVVDVREVNGVLEVASRATLQVRVGPLTVFSYSQQCTESWRERRLRHLNCVTVKEGRRINVSIEREAAGLRVRANGRSQLFAPGAEPTSWWSRDVLLSQTLIDTQTGERAPLRVERIGAQNFRIGGRDIRAEHFRVHGSSVIDLWYDAAGHWIGCAFSARGQRVEYRLVSPPDSAPA